MNDRQDPSLDRRAAAWAALAELFAGRQLLDEDFEHAAITLRATGFGADALERMLWREVAPVFGTNLSLLNPTPQMEGWSPGFVRDAVLAHLSRPWHGLIAFAAYWLTPRMVRREIQRDWSEVRRRLATGDSRPR